MNLVDKKEGKSTTKEPRVQKNFGNEIFLRQKRRAEKSS